MFCSLCYGYFKCKQRNILPLNKPSRKLDITCIKPNNFITLNMYRLTYNRLKQCNQLSLLLNLLHLDKLACYHWQHLDESKIYHYFSNKKKSKRKIFFFFFEHIIG